MGLGIVVEGWSQCKVCVGLVVRARVGGGGWGYRSMGVVK